MEVMVIFGALSLLTGWLTSGSAKKQQERAVEQQYLYEASLANAQNKVYQEQTQAQLEATKEAEESRLKAYQTILEIQKSAGFQRGTVGPLFQVIKR